MYVYACIRNYLPPNRVYTVTYIIEYTNSYIIYTCLYTEIILGVVCITTICLLIYISTPFIYTPICIYYLARKLLEQIALFV